MSAGEINRHPIEIVVNYWETPVSQFPERLDELVRRGLTHIATFVPWQAVESDISQQLPRFLLAAAERRISVALILTPEVGVHYANSGMPKDLISKPEMAAKDATLKPIAQVLAPGVYQIPSLLSPDFSKRFSNFMTRIDSVLSDLERNHIGSTDLITAVLTSSFWKYYRAPRHSSVMAFGGIAGDFSSHASLAYRSRIDHFYGQAEFSSVHGTHPRWKNRALEDTNRKWFATHCEEVFKNRTSQLFGRRSCLKVQAREMFTPEADPAYSYTQILQNLTGGKADFYRLSALIDEYALRASYAREGASNGWVHLTDFAGFQTLADNEKQFLILKSLLLMGGRNGGVLIDENVWHSLSNGFRAKAISLMQMLMTGDLYSQDPIYYLVANLWSDIGELGDELVDLLGSRMQVAHSLDRVFADENAEILFVDSTLVYTEEFFKKLKKWVEAGHIAVLPKTTLFSEAALGWVEDVSESSRPIQMNLGLQYQIFQSGLGKLIFFELPKNAMAAASASPQSLRTFIESMLGLAQVRKNYGTSDIRLTTIELKRRSGGAGLFVLNSSSQKVSGEIFFEGEVSISDLTSPASSAIPASRFEIEVPSCGLIPLAVHGLGEDARERVIAAENSEVLKENVIQAAMNELPGLSDRGALWS